MLDILRVFHNSLIWATPPYSRDENNTKVVLTKFSIISSSGDRGCPIDHDLEFKLEGHIKVNFLYRSLPQK